MEWKMASIRRIPQARRALRALPLGRLALTALVLTSASCWNGEDLQPKVTNNVEDWRDEVIYQLLTDRFADGDLNNDFNVDRAAPGRYHGGDFRGVQDKIPYLKELGVTAVWISPVVKNVEEDAGHASYHGYWAQDFSSVNPHFGDLAELREMVNALHAAGIKVILDIVTNHVGQLFYYDINGNGSPDESVAGYQDNVVHISEWDPDYDPRGIMGFTSLGESGPAPIRWLWMPEINRVPPMPVEFQNKDWYNRRGRVTDWNQDDQVVRGDFPGGLKDLNTSLPEVRDALFKVYSAWLDSADFDGFRIDTVKHVEHESWQDFCGRMRAHAAQLGKKNFFMFGEVFDGRDDKVGSYSFNGELDTLFNFPQKFAIDSVFKSNGATRILEQNLAARRHDFSSEAIPSIGGVNSQQVIVNFLDNHDVPRFLYDKPSVPALQTALAYLFFEEGIPDVYYGTEQEYSGGNDPRNREDLSRSEYSTQTPTFKWISRIAKLRKAYPALRRGEMTFRYSTEHTGDEQDSGVLAFERATDKQTVLVAINVSDAKTSQTSFGNTDMHTGFAAGTALVDVLSGEQVTVGAEGALRLELGPRQTRLLVPSEQVVAGL
jgi:glycosidase